ncbi:MAG: sensor histidine kinase [Planctomycetota bacterium]|jgi:signal transduction histidine kinase
MSTIAGKTTDRKQDLGSIISAYNQVSGSLKKTHEKLSQEVHGLREELKRKNEQLRRRERLAALGEMAAGLAHEIRNPLGAIQLLTALLKREVYDRPEALRLIDKIVSSADTMEAIVADVLTFGRPRDPDPARIELENLLAETMQLASAKIARTNVEVEISGKFAGVELITDGVMLQRALLNLLINAVEASAEVPTGGGDRVVVIDLTEEGPARLTVTVSDSGPGVASDLMEQIFNPFFTTKDDGTGLGLAIVHQIAEALGGRVRAANRNSGRGAVFSLCLPRELNVERAHKNIVERR